jgi:hypothetical protein
VTERHLRLVRDRPLLTDMMFEALILLVNVDQSDFIWANRGQRWMADYYTYRSHSSPMHEQLCYRAWELLFSLEEAKQPDMWLLGRDRWRAQWAATLPELDEALEKMGAALDPDNWAYFRLSVDKRNYARNVMRAAIHA